MSNDCRVTPDSPDWSVYETVAGWHLTLDALPTWDEVLEVEYIRQRGELNMLSGDLQRYAYDRGLYHAVSWLQRCKSNKVFWGHLYEAVLPSLEAERGPRGTWLTPEHRATYLRKERSHRLEALQAELNRLRNEDP